MSGSQGGQLKTDNLWNRAIETLSEDDRSWIDFKNPDRIAVLESTLALAEDKKRQCFQQRWKIRRSRGRNLILRDVFAKIVVWVQKFKEIGDVAVQYDPGHATLPWASVRLLLEVTIKDNQIFGAMIEGLEVAASMLPRYAIYEDIYLRQPSVAVDRLKDSLITLYSAILTFLSRTITYFGKSTLRRIAKSVFTLTDTDVDTMTREINALQRVVDEDAQLINAERQQVILQGIEHLSSSSRNWHFSNNMNISAQNLVPPNIDFGEQGDNLLRLMNSLHQPLSRMADRLVNYYDNLAQEERLNILGWLSTIPYTQHHQNIRKDRLQDSGTWLLNHGDFQEWFLASYSSILWVHGPPGSGKSKLMSVVVDEALARNDTKVQVAPLAYFYCARDVAEPERSDPEKVLLSIARQLSGTGVMKPLCEATIQKYATFTKTGQDIRGLSLQETVELILELLYDNPATIVIDALDECDPARRHELLDSLDAIIQNSANVVKILVSSRDDGDLHCRLETSPNLYISAKYNAEDIQRFIRYELRSAVEKKRLLSGRVSENLRTRIIETLEAGSQGMFRWVSLQLQNLCDSRRIKVEDDLLEELGRLPKTLSDLYDRTYEEIMRSAKHSSSMAIKVLKWLRVAQRTLSIPEIISAVSIKEDGTRASVTVRDILNMTCNLVVEDSAVGCLRYAHLSVREYLDSRLEFSDDEAHRLLAERCLESYVVHYSKDPLSKYAMFYWPMHYLCLSPRVRSIVLYTLLRHFLFQGPGTAIHFSHWRNDIGARTDEISDFTVEEVYGSNCIFTRTVMGKYGTQSRSSNQEDYLRLDLQAATTPFLTACIYGLCEVLELLAKSQPKVFNAQKFDFCQALKTPYLGYNGLHIGILCRRFEIVDFLLKNGLDISQCTAKGESPLHLATRRRSATMVGLLLGHGADPNAISYLKKADLTDDKEMRPKSSLQSLDTNESVLRSSLGFRQTSGGVLSVIDEDAEAPVHLAAREGDTRCLSELLQKGANVDAKTKLGSTALHTALLGGRTEVIKMLLEAGADANDALLFGRTPLHLAAATGNDQITALLLAHGGDPQRRDVVGKSVFDVALRYGHAPTLEILKPSLNPESSSFQLHIQNISTDSNSFLNLPVTIPYRTSIEARQQAVTEENEDVFKPADQNDSDAVAADDSGHTPERTAQNDFNYFDWQQI